MVEQKNFTVEDSAAGERLDQYLTGVLDGVSRSQIQKLISDEMVLVNGRIVSKKFRVTASDSVVVNKSFSCNVNHIKPQDVPFGILYEDNFIVAVNKPAGLVVHPGSGVKDGTLVNGLAFRIQSLSDGFAADRPGIVHRLDKDTSGVVLVAKTNQAHVAMASLFQNRTVEKHYIGFCVGTPSEQCGMIDLPLDRSSHDPIKRAPSIHGKVAKTEFTVMKSKNSISAIQFRPYTGRTHQIRVHASAKGFPIVADKLYGGGKERLLRISPLDRPFVHSIMKCFTRHALHAHSISFEHPFTKTKIVISAPIPDDFREASFRFGFTQLFE